MSESSCSSKRRCFYGDILPNTSLQPLFKILLGDSISARNLKAMVIINNFKSKFDVIQVQLNTLNMALDTCKIERDKKMKKVDALEAINIVEANKARESEEKVLKLKMFIIISCALFVGFVAAFLMK
uniref:Uncharacterized protein n=2 Tax=Nicotiana TaxID=4085 RepID=A0A1S3WY60_TOBAC|nr:PREDICTED: uncharacterized protein LOC104216704 [Nicotiana sylvestris]XP_016432608.1 PREDICTED: uncharacterized protein LOC107759239 [Nicotiana tabacum]